MATQTDPFVRVSGPGLGVRLRLHDDCAVLAPHGELDCATVTQLEEALHTLPDSVTRVVLNMAGVTFMDSTGLHFLDRLRAFGHRRGIATQAVHFRRQPRRLLELNRVCDLPGATGPEEAVDDADRGLGLAPAPLPEAPPPAEEAPAEESVREAQRLREENQQLKDAMGSRSVIDQALGMIMALGPCTREPAWQALVEVSQHSNTKVRDVAGALVATGDGSPLPHALKAEVTGAFSRLRPVVGDGTP